MLKTLKRKIALVAVAGLGAGLISVAPASAAGAAIVADNLNLTQAGSTIVVTAAAGPDTAKARVGAQTIVLTEAAAVEDASDYNIIVSTATTSAGILADGTNSATLNTPTYAGTNASSGAVTTTAASNAASAFFSVAGKAIVVAAVDGTANTTSVTFNTASLAAGTWTIYADGTPADAATAAGTLAIGTITVFNVGAPSTVAFDVAGRTQIVASVADSAFTATVKDSAGRSTFLIGAEAISYAFDTVASTAVQVPATPGNTVAADVAVSAAQVFTGQSVTIDNTLIGVGAAFNTTPNTTYKLNATIISGLAAFGSTSATYRWSTSTAGLVGTLAIQKAAVTTATHSMPAAGTVAAGDFTMLLKDSTGAVVQGVTPTITSSLANTVAAAGATSAAGAGNAFTYTATTSGTDTVTFSISTGGLAVISTTLAITITGFGGTLPVLANATVAIAAGAGTGFVPGTAPAYTAGLTVSKVTISMTGLDASKVAAVAATPTGGGLTSTVSTASPIADASGKITFDVTLATALTTNFFTVTVDADGGGGLAAVTVAIVTYATAVPDVKTSPLTATTTFAAPGSTQSIVATVADQFSVAAPGATVTLTNSSVPIGATAQTAATLTVGAAGTATLSVVLGTVVGNYVYSITGRDYNNVALAATNVVTYTVTASGGPKAITILAGVNTATTGYRVIVDNDGSIDLANPGAVVYTTATQTTVTTTESKPNTVITVKVTDDAGTGVQGVAVVAAPDAGVLVNSAVATTTFANFNAAADLTIATDATGVATFLVTSTKPGTPSIKFTAGSVSVTGSFNAVTQSQLTTPAVATGRTISLDKAASDVTGNVVQFTATVKDVFGNAVAGVNVSGAISGVAGRFTGGGRSQTAVASDANGQVVFEVTSNGVEAGAGVLTVSAAESAIGTPAPLTGLISDDLTANSATQFTKTSTKSATAALTVKAATTSAASTEIASVKTDVATANAAVKTLATQVTVLQASVATLIDSLTTQIAALLQSVSALTKAVAKLQAKKK